MQKRKSRASQSRQTARRWLDQPPRLQRARRDCQRSRKWRFPTDALPGLAETDMQSPAA
jgi:hypothetical protein